VSAETSSRTIASVLLITPRWTADGGVATHVMNSAAVLAEHGVKVSVLAAQVDPAVTAPGVTLLPSPGLFDSALSPEQRLGEAIAASPSVIHAHQFEDPEILAFVRGRAPLVVSAHGYSMCTSGVHYFQPGHECTRPHGLGCVPNLTFRGCAHTREIRWLPASYRRASAAREALRRADMAVSHSSVVDRHLSANGVERRRIVPLFTMLEPPLGSGHATRRRVVFAGRVVTPKGVGVLVRAAREVQAEFVICGDGWRLEQMRQLARRLGVADRIRFTGWLSAELLGHELAEASVVAIPSLWPEPFGLVGIEAFAAGRPVVASATGGVADWLEDGVNGLGVAPGDVRALAQALNELLDDPERQRAMGDAGRRAVAERFSPQRHLEALLGAYGSARAGWEASSSSSAATVSRHTRVAPGLS
jgi:glycosyltransferase involved in cell wall biosynthesis